MTKGVTSYGLGTLGIIFLILSTQDFLNVFIQESDIEFFKKWGEERGYSYIENPLTLRAIESQRNAAIWKAVTAATLFGSATLLPRLYRK
jgi:hypothetical protein